MAKHFISVCMFCLLCATHSPCASHVEVSHSRSQNRETKTAFKDPDSPPLIELDSMPREKLKVNGQSDSEFFNVKNNNRISIKPKIRSYFKRVKRENLNKNVSKTSVNRTNSDINVKQGENYLKKIFEMFGDGNSMTVEGFEKLVIRLDLKQLLSLKLNEPTSQIELASHREDEPSSRHINSTCVDHKEIFAALIHSNNSNTNAGTDVIDNDTLHRACPALLYNMVVGGCVREQVEFLHMQEPSVPAQYNHVSVWFYSNLAVILISACGISGLVVIPIMQKRFYHQLLQFLVALAVGTLAGDALLHLLPHAMSSSRHHYHGGSRVHSHDLDDNHDENMWKGFVAMSGLIFFFSMEKVISLAAKCRKRKQLKNKLPSRVKVMKPDGNPTTNRSEKECKHKYSSFPYCYDEIAMMDAPLEDHVYRLAGGTDSIESHNNTATTILNELGSDSDIQSFKKSCSGHSEKLETNQNMTECPSESNAVTCTEVNKMLGPENEKEDTGSLEYTVILREHENRHHGHSHAHGHVHSAPKNLSSVAWMVIMGDGLHNFTDGMAIGAAFAGGIAGGFSTAVAVFCHELPHELGDFAMLLKAGMSMKQALIYNLLSSVLCLFGNACGVWLGNIEYASSWVFAAAAGMFLYIALVDMIPELSSGHDSEETLFQCGLQLGGLLLGYTIMTLIAFFEHDLKTIFNDPL